MLRSSQVNDFQNRFELQGKERDLTFGLNWVNFGARRMNPTIGRMDNIDAMASKFASHSLYNYTLNNPLVIIDPDGNESRDIWGNTTFNGFVGDDGNGNFVGSTGGGGEDKEKGKESESSKKVKFKDSSKYDYSKEGIDGKGADDWAYFVNGSDGNYLSRAWRLWTRDWSQANSEQKTDLVLAAAPVGIVLKGAKGALGAAKGARAFFEGAKYSDKVLRQMSKVDDLFHGFPKSIDGFATKYGQWTTKLGGDGKVYHWLKMKGSYGGKTGVFEYTKDANGLINHRFFNISK